MKEPVDMNKNFADTCRRIVLVSNCLGTTNINADIWSSLWPMTIEKIDALKGI
jgi:hypothetical protein